MARSLALENRVALVVLATGLPAVALSCGLLWSDDRLSFHPTLLLTVLVLALWLGSAFYLRQRLAHQWRMLSSLVEAVRVGDFSLRGSAGADAGGYGELVTEINTLAHGLREQRLRSEETQRLLDTVIRDIDVAIFAFAAQGCASAAGAGCAGAADSRLRLTLANPAACRLFGDRWPQLHQRTADDLQLTPLLANEGSRVLEHSFAGVNGVWRVQVERFMEHGQAQRLLFVTDLKQVLRAEELNAWKRLIRVLSHEVNNSLAPIASVSASLQALVTESGKDAASLSEHHADLNEGLQVIHQRAKSLTEFIRRYADLARLPPPSKRPLTVPSLLARLPALLPELALQIRLPEQAVTLFADPVQLEQLLINLLKNSGEAMQSKGMAALAEPAAIEIVGDCEQRQFCLQIRDRGPGLANAHNLFVPFYSTKPGGSGIGLVLCRQIAEAHDGTLQLSNRDDGAGCVAELRLPLARAP